MGVKFSFGKISTRGLLFILAVTLSLISAVQASAKHATHVKRLEDVKESYDYVIIGGGVAGLTLGDRLTEDGNYTVLVIEHGNFYDADNDPLGQLDCQYNISSVPQPEISNRTIPILIGNCVGGGSAINAEVLTRGTIEEYAIWAELGGEGSTWNWEGMLPYFKKAVHFIPPNDDVAAEFGITYDMDVWGQHNDTRVFGSYPPAMNPLIKIVHDGLLSIPGVKSPKDGNAGTDGVFYFPRSVNPVNQNRSYARTGHWDGLNRPNYELITAYRANKILFDGDEAVAVSFVPRDGGNATIVNAKREVILSAGTIHTPQVLQLSGIGPASALRDANVSVKLDLPGVGSNFQDHPYGPAVTWTWGNPPVTNSTATRMNLGTFLSLPVVAPDVYETIAAKYEAQDLSQYVWNGTHPTVMALYKEQQRIFSRKMRSTGTSYYCQLGVSVTGPQPAGMHPVSRGRVYINPADPEGEPLVDFGTLTNPLDMDLMIAYVRFLRRLIKSDGMAPYEPTEAVPGEAVSTDQQLDDWIRPQYTPHNFHPIGTSAKVPLHLGGVVDEDLLVYGLKRLRIVDASIIPTTVGATTQLTTYTIAEKAADLIKALQ